MHCTTKQYNTRSAMRWEKNNEPRRVI